MRPITPRGGQRPPVDEAAAAMGCIYVIVALLALASMVLFAMSRAG